MLDPSKRVPTLVLVAGILVLLVAVAIGERMGDNVLGQAPGPAVDSTQIRITPVPDQTSAPYGPDWKRSSTLSAAGDPGFPDPRIPPVPLPTRAPTPVATATPQPTPTLNPNIPIWRQTPIPTATPSGGALDSPTPEPTPTATNTP